ncbi:hypothetical protein FRB97_007928 [Tulasnella sp. 331]|nr:hypothetical protein FRB97_007928 [Tulasnella sp. 331]
MPMTGTSVWINMVMGGAITNNVSNYFYLSGVCGFIDELDGKCYWVDDLEPVITAEGEHLRVDEGAPTEAEDISDWKLGSMRSRSVTEGEVDDMRGYIINKYIKPSELKFENNIPEPTPSHPNHVIVDVYSAGLNYFDFLQLQGKYQTQPPFPWVPGCEFGGKIAKNSPIPKGCPLKAGDSVFGAAQGACGEQLVCDWHVLQKIPAGMTFDQAASLTVTWPTSYEALVGRANVQPGEWVLVHAAAGGVGLLAVQIAKVLGAKVIGTAGSADKLEVAKKYGGADYTVDYSKDGWQKEVMKITGGHGVDVVYDPVGMVQKSLKVIAWDGRIVVIGFAAGAIEKIPMNLVLLKNISLVGLHWGAYYKHEPEHPAKVWSELLALYADGKIKPIIYTEVYKHDALAKGLKDLVERKTWGKAVMRVRDSDEGKVSAKL